MQLSESLMMSFSNPSSQTHVDFLTYIPTQVYKS